MIRVDPAIAMPAPTPAAGAGTDAPARALIARQLAMLGRLAEIGMEIAEEAGRQATGAPTAVQGGSEGSPMRDPALVYVRAARAVRLTIALQSRLMNDLAALDRAGDLADVERKSARTLRLRQLVERAVEAEHDGDEDAIEQRAWEVRERLADAELDAELEGLPFAAVVARVCEDLGLAPDLTARILAAAGPENDLRNDPVVAPRGWPPPHAPQAEAPPPGRVPKQARPRAPPH